MECFGFIHQDSTGSYKLGVLECKFVVDYWHPIMRRFFDLDMVAEGQVHPQGHLDI